MSKDTQTVHNGEVSSCCSSSSSSCYADVGFMFEGAQPTHTVSLSFPLASEESVGSRYRCCNEHGRNAELSRDENDGNDEGAVKGRDTTTGESVIRVELKAVDGDPGAVQSGHYLWPAAPALARYLVSACGANLSGSVAKVSSSCDCKDGMCSRCASCRLALVLERLPIVRPLHVVELGAGCGLAGLVALQALSLRYDVSSVLFTDHDPGTLDRCRENHEATLRVLESSNGAASVSKLSRIHVLFETLSWGDEIGASNVRKSTSRACFKEEGNEEVMFDVVLGSDLIYCREVVRPLLLTASYLMTKVGKVGLDEEAKELPCMPFFLMTQSFSYESDTEREIDDVCDDIGLERTVLLDELSNLRDKGVKVQIFTPQVQ